MDSRRCQHVELAINCRIKRPKFGGRTNKNGDRWCFALQCVFADELARGDWRLSTERAKDPTQISESCTANTHKGATSTRPTRRMQPLEKQSTARFQSVSVSFQGAP